MGPFTSLTFGATQMNKTGTPCPRAFAVYDCNKKEADEHCGGSKEIKKVAVI